ncbi:GAF domain-containing protein [Aggregicoccus sp. 17bor-14]|uniref:sensor histidine kinase n=1 Tax=Myxococcaceae TaxID=31 RepID=UPI00129C2BBF|nr:MULTISPECIES: ATP-binding protein [Myxococcaceae]MBF5045238.1 GAF domain-containing protein [Simulacricoccus sp. 17bor-14]MRI90979.1 GAF domain-containing protein [Aggregicoccus sp. 17bor-14]
MTLSATPPRPLAVLHVEDSADDVLLLERELRHGGFAIARSAQVETEQALEAALAQGPWDVVLADYTMPHYSAPAALQLLRRRGLDIPFIVVSGTVGEHEGVEMMRAGASDYFGKHYLTRLPAAVERELQAAQSRRERARGERDRALLASASELLGRSLDYERTLEQVARLAVPEVADWCAVFLPDGHGGLRLGVVAHQLPGLEAQVQRLSEGLQLNPAARVGPLQVARTGEPELVTRASAERLAQIAPPALKEALDALGICTGVHVPLASSQGVLGVLSLVGMGARAPMGPQDLALAQELARRASLALQNARLYREAQAAVHLREEFLQVAAHELRTPLTTLRLQLGRLARSEEVRSASPALGGGLERAQRQVGRLSTLVESLLDVSRLESGALQLHREEVDLAELVREVAERYADEARGAGCPLQLELAPGLVGPWDRLRLDQAVAALVANAFKFGPGHPVQLSTARVGAAAQLVVEDRGIGLAPADLERIFERFERAVSERHYGGLGLGLYLARRSVRAHGGELRAEARPGAGARFVLELPLAALEGFSPSPGGSRSGSGGLH